MIHARCLFASDVRTHLKRTSVGIPGVVFAGAAAWLGVERGEADHWKLLSWVSGDDLFRALLVLSEKRGGGTVEPTMHLVPLFSQLKAELAAPFSLPNATGAHNKSLEVLLIRFTPMLHRTHEFPPIGDANSTLSTTCVLSSIVVLLQMTVVLHGVMMSRVVKPFVVDRLLSRSEEYIRFTPIMERRGGVWGQLVA